MKSINIIGACSDFGVHIDGTKLGPEVLESHIDKTKVNEIINIYAKDINKELEKNNKQKNLKSVNEFNSRLYSAILDTLNSDFFPLTIGGDHSIAIASALASIKKYKNLGIIWFDSHGDYHTFETTTSGNIHGLPFATITNYKKSILSNFHSGNYFNPKNAVLVGGRDIDEPLELENLKNAGVTVFSTEDVHKFGTDYIYSKAFDIASAGTNGVHVSYDLDVIDPKLAPGVSIPAKNGISLEEAYDFVTHIIKNKEKVKSFDLVEFNPLRDIDEVTQKIAQQILSYLLNNL